MFYWVPSEQERSYDLNQVMEEAQWQVFDGELNFGYKHQVIWAMQNVSFKSADDWILEIAYPFLDYLDIYIFKGDQLVRELHTGDGLPFKQRVIRVPNFVLDLKSSANTDYRMVVRIETQGTMMLPVSWWSETGYAEHLAKTQLIYGGYYGALGIIILYHIFVFLVVRERGYLLYSASMSAFILLQLAYDGRGFSWFWPSYPELNSIVFPLFYCIYQLVNLSFISEFLHLKQHSKCFYLFFRTLQAIVLVNIVLVFVLPYHSSVPIAVVTGIIGLISSFIVSAIIWYRGFKPARYFTIAWGFFLAGLLLLNFRGLGVVETTWVSQYGYLIGSVMQALFLAFSLADRINAANRGKRATEKQLIHSQEQHLSILKRYQDLYENAPIGHFQSNNQYQLTSVNKACAQLFGFDQPEQMLAKVKDIRNYLKSDFADFQQSVRSTRELGMQNDIEIKITDILGKERWLNINMRYWPVGDSFEGSVQDITERKIADELRRDLDQERLNVMERFSLGMAEEINTPLGSNVATTGFVSDSIDAVLEKSEHDDISISDYQKLLNLTSKSLSLVANNQRRIIRVVRRFREVASQHVGLLKSQFNLLGTVQKCIENQRWKLAGWRVSVDGPEDIIMYSYAHAINAILEQLVDNALAHSEADFEQNPEINIRIEKVNDNKVSMTFSDNGIGVENDMAKNLGQPFYTSKQGPDGHIGLGLYMVYNLVSRSLNGRLYFPIIGHGFSVQLLIPMEVDLAEVE